MSRCNKGTPIGLALTIGLLCGGGGSAAVAADANSAATPEQAVANDQGNLEEVVVTARRRQEDIQQVPISIQSLSADDLTMRNIDTTAGLDHAIIDFAPAPSSFFGLEQASFRIRGLPNVGVYYDGVAHQEEFGFLGDLVELDRIEVLRGPQGTLFGKNSLAGAVQYVTKEPADQFRLKTSITAGEFGRLNVSGSADIPLSDTLFTKLTVAHVYRQGYLPSVTVHQDFGSEDNLIARADVLWKPIPEFSWRFIIEQDNLGTNGNASTLASLSFSCAPIASAGGNPGPACVYNGASTHGEPQLYVSPSYVFGASQQWKTASNYNGPEMFTDSTNYTTILNYDINKTWSVKGIGSYRGVDSEHFEDFASVGVDMFEGENTNKIYESTAEAQLLFNSDQLTGTTGFYYYKDFRRYRRNNWFSNELKADANPADNAAANAFFGLPPGTIAQFGPPDPDQLFYYRIHGIAGYSEWTWKPLSPLSLTAGVRWNKDTNNTVSYYPAQPIPVLCCVPSTSFATAGLEGPAVDESFTNTSPRFSAQWQWSPQIMTYITYSEGFNSGGGSPAGQPPNVFVLPYKPETLKNYEIGLRSELLDRTLLLNVSAFYDAYQNVQVTVDEDFNSVTVNAGKGIGRGVEIEGQWAPTHSFALNYGLAYLKTQLSAVPGAGIAEGVPFPYAPERSANVGAQYMIPLPGKNSTLTLRADEGWTSAQNTAPDDTNIPIGSYGLLGLSAMYQPTDQRWNSKLYVTNLLDKYYLLGGYNIPPLGNLGAATVGFRRMWGITFNYLFQ